MSSKRSFMGEGLKAAALATAVTAASISAQVAETIKVGLVAALSGQSVKSGEAITRGLSVAILGANGAGKSNIMRALAGLHRSVQGSILLNNEGIDKLDVSGISSQGLALVPEGRQVLPELGVRDNLLIGDFQRDFRKEEESADKAVEAAYLGLGDKEKDGEDTAWA